MKSVRTLFSLVGVAGFCACSAFAQTPDSSTKPDETVTLNPFVVATQRDEGYLSTSSTAIGRVSQLLENIPQQIEIINAAFIKDIAPTNFQDTLRYSSDISFSNSARTGPNPIIRGFDTSAGELRNGFKIQSSPFFGNFYGIESIEQVEVVKGAAAVQYGPSQPGGVVNIITKQPLFTQQTNLTVALHSEGGYTASIDSTGPIPISKSSDGRDVLAYRVVYAHQAEEGYQKNNDFTNRTSYYGHITYAPFRDLVINAEVSNDDFKQSFYNSQLVPQAQLSNPSSQVQLPYSIEPVGWTYQDTNSYYQEHDRAAQLSAVLTHDFGKFGVWSLRAGYSWNYQSLFRLLTDTAVNPTAVTAADIGKVVNFSQTVSQADVDKGRLWLSQRLVRQIDTFPEANLSTQWDLTGKFETGPIKHTALFGTDGSLGMTINGPVGVTQADKRAYVGAEGNGNAIWVDNADLRAITNVNFNDVRSATNPQGITSVVALTNSGLTYNKNMRFGVPWLTVPDKQNYDKDFYLFDAMSALDDRLQLSLGTRYDKIGQYLAPAEFTKTQWTYRYGAVFKILPQLHVFALHNESFLPNSAAANAAFGFFIPPQKGKQDEVGVRLPFFQNRLLIESSVYKISVTNVVQNNPFGVVNVPSSFFAIVPGITNKGADFSAKLNLSKSLQLLFAYTHTEIENASGPAQLAQGIASYPVNNVPSNQVTVFAKYFPEFDLLHGLYLTGGYRYTGARPGGGVGALPALYLNSYSIYDAGLGYAYHRWSFDVSLRNVFNVYAFRAAAASNRLYPEEPRAATFSVSAKF